VVIQRNNDVFYSAVRQPRLFERQFSFFKKNFRPAKIIKKGRKGKLGIPMIVNVLDKVNAPSYPVAVNFGVGKARAFCRKRKIG
jgi:hypothetical protein